MPATYENLATVTTTGSQSAVSFTSISGSYTDLVIVENALGSASAYSSIYFNTDNAGTSYSSTYIFGNGTSASSGRASNQSTFATLDYISSTTPNAHIYHIQNYSNTTTNKTMLMRYNLSNDGPAAYVGLWRSTAAITTITFTRLSGTYTNGSTYTLYGIKAA